jgi:DNA-binding NarL/FixJ family response regulator
MKVFIVDDSTLIRERLKTMISEHPQIEISGEAQSARQAIDSIRKIKPDVVILDIRMSEGNGIEVLKNIKKNKWVPKIIILTNYPYPQYRKKCMEAGANFFFDKSTEFQRITEVLKNLIEESNAQNN